MKKLSKKSTEFIELFFKLKDMDSITIKRHDMDILYSHYKYSWYEFNELDNKIEILNNRINNAIEYLQHFNSDEICENITGIANILLNILRGKM